jgi:hypothetical protein
MKKYLLLFVLIIILSPANLFSNGIRENTLRRDWDKIETSSNFKYYNVLFNFQGEETGLEETTEPMYGQEIVIEYRINNFSTGDTVHFAVFDKNMENVIVKTIPIYNNRIRFEGVLLTTRQNAENIISGNYIQFFCVLILPDFSMVKSETINTRMTANMEFSLINIPLSEINSLNYNLALESTDGEYRQERKSLRDGRLYDGSRHMWLIVTFTDIIPQKTYNFSIDYGAGEKWDYSDTDALDLLRYYNAEDSLYK